MGCVSSQNELHGRLEAAERRMKDIPRGKKNEGMASIESVAREICAIFQELLAAGAKDRDSMRRVEVLSDQILDNLMGRLTSEDLKEGRDVCKEWLGSIEKVAKMLDAVRATKASTAVSEQVDAVYKSMSAAVEQAAAADLQNIQKLGQRLKKEPGKLIEISKGIMESAKKANDLAPESKKVTEQLLQVIMQVSGVILQQYQIWGTSYDNCTKTKELAADVDEMATRLVGIVGATWDPPLAPEVDKLQDKIADDTCTKCVKEAEAQLRNSDAGGAFKVLKILLDWWPLVKEREGADVQVAGVFAKITIFTSDMYAKAIGDDEEKENIKKFVTEIEELRAKFDGLPAPGEGETSLGATLTAIEMKAAVEKALDTLGTLIPNFSKDKKAISSAIQALQVAASKWSSVSGEASLVQKLEKHCTAMEQWAETQVAKVTADKIVFFLKLAEGYDDCRSKCNPPEPKDGALLPRITSRAVAGYLKAVEDGLKKVAPPHEKFEQSICDNLKHAADIVPEGEEKLRKRLADAFKATDTCLTEKFKNGLGSPDTNEKKEVILLNFAETVDKVRDGAALMELLFSDEGASLVKRLEKLKENHMGEMVDQIEGQVAAEDFEKLLDSLQNLESVAAKTPLEDSLQQRLQATLSSMKAPFVEACKKAAARGDLKSVGNYEFQAPRIDDSLTSLGFKAQGLEASILDIVVGAHLTAAQQTLDTQNGSISDCAVLERELEALEFACKKESCGEDVKKQVERFTASLETALVASAMGSAGTGAVTKCAAVADKLLTAIEGGDPSGKISERVKHAKVVGDKLAEATKELEKPEKSDPRVTVKVLQDLKANWEPVKDVEACQNSLGEVLTKFRSKLDEACKKASEADGDAREQKLAALVQLAQQADKAQEPLASMSKGLKCENFAERISSVLAGEHLSALEAELNKTSGMQPPELLKHTKGLAKIWKDVADVDDVNTRWTAAHTKIKTRMSESMDDAIKSSAEGKKKALLHFAKEFDSACSDFSDGSLAEELRAKVES